MIEGLEEEIVKKIKEARDKDEEVIKAVEEMKKAGVKMLRDEEWQIEEELVLKEGRVYVPKDEKLRVEIIWLHHDMLIAGHGGQWKTVELVTSVKIVDGGLYFYSLFSLYFIFSFLFLFCSIFRTTQVRVYQSHCHISHKLMA